MTLIINFTKKLSIGKYTKENEITKNVINKNRNQILEELNIKDLRFVDSESDIVEYLVKPNFSVLGQKFGKDMNRLVNELKKVSAATIINQLKLNVFIFIQILKISQLKNSYSIYLKKFFLLFLCNLLAYF